MVLALPTGHPGSFSNIVGQRRAGGGMFEHLRFLVRLFIYLLRTLCENFIPRSLKVRSPGHVKWPHLRKGLNARHSYTEWPMTLTLSAIDIRNGINETYISEFWYRWPKVRSFLAITYDRDQLDELKHRRCVQADDADRLIYNMTFSD